MSVIGERTREIALKLTSWPSVTGTDGEAQFAGRLAAWLPGFDRVWLEPAADSGGKRFNLFALKRRRSRATVVLTGHYDTVPFDDYGELEDLALVPERLSAAMSARLRQLGKFSLALADIESGAFLPGRGLLDMKAGLAAGLAAAERYGGEASILFLALADEEGTSAGARSAARQLPRIAMEEGLDVRLVINLDAISDQGDGSRGRVAAMGSIGKLLPFAFCVGRQAHACYPEDGVNAAYIAAELVTEFELAETLAERSGTERAAVPTALCAKDLKSGYNVTTPAESWVYWNTLQHRRGADEVMAICLELARVAMQRVEVRTGVAVPVMTYAEFAESLPPDAFTDFTAQPAAGDLPDTIRRAIQHGWGRSGRSGPAAVIGFGSIPYPAVSLRDPALEHELAAALQPFGIGTIRYFPGISDMSFLGSPSATLSAASANTPLWGTAFEAVEAANYPCINLGPWGRDYHHWTERLHAPYAFDILPSAIMAVIEAAAGKS